MVKKTFSITLTAMMTAAGHTQATFAVAAGIPPQTLSNLLSKNRPDKMMWATVQKLATALNVSTDVFRTQ